MPVRSDLLFSGVYDGADIGTWKNVWTSPADVLALIKGFSYGNYAGVATQGFLGLWQGATFHGPLLLTPVTQPAEASYMEVWHAVPPGYSLAVYTAVGPAYFVGSGAALELA